MSPISVPALERLDTYIKFLSLFSFFFLGGGGEGGLMVSVDVAVILASLLSRNSLSQESTALISDSEIIVWQPLQAWRSRWNRAYSCPYFEDGRRICFLPA